MRAEMSPADLARRLETSNSSVSAWLNGGSSPHRTRCYAIAEALGVPAGEVLAAAGHRDISYNRDTLPNENPDTGTGAGAVKHPAEPVAQAKRLIGQGEAAGKRLALTLDIERYLDLRPELREQVERAAIEAAILAAADAIKGSG